MAGIKEIAAQLNISSTAVSYALNGRSGKVSEATRVRVLALARDLGYVPNPSARALIARRTGNIGLVSRQFNNALYTALLLELAVAVDERGGNLVTCVTGRVASEHQGQRHLLHTGSVDGVLAIPYALPGLETVDSPWMQGPMVLLLPDRDLPGVPSVTFDDADGIAQAAAHLWTLGHRTILFVQGLGPKNEDSPLGLRRLTALRAAWQSLGGNGEYDILVARGQATTGGGYDALRQVLGSPGVLPPFTGVIAYNDQIAQGAVSALSEHGLRVPQDVSLIGWNDLDDRGRFDLPARTAVRVPIHQLARTALDLLHLQIEGLHPVEYRLAQQSVRLPVELIVRASTSPARRRENAL
ncbi:MAG: LacI family DNA-binding transcriptional regulator [Cytophagales bacterium]|nr:LacI family DNA-binding transcriptional regulator [Armatimonadota bacterium]